MWLFRMASRLPARTSPTLTCEVLEAASAARASKRIYQSENDITFLYFGGDAEGGYGEYRIIPIDGRPHGKAAEFDITYMGNTGAFKAFRLVNPHSVLRLDVKSPDGSTVEWSMLGGSVQALARLGIGRTGPNALRPGDEITVTHVPAADGKSPIGLLSAITYADGHTVRFRSPDE